MTRFLSITDGRRRRLAITGGLSGAVSLAAALAIFSSTEVAAQGTAKPPAPRAPAVPASGVDTVISLVKGGMSESMVIRTLKSEGKTYTLTTADLLKLQKAGVTETVIEAMTAPASGAAGAPAAASPAAASSEAPSSAATEYPPDLPDVAPVTKRRVAIKAFDYATVTNWVMYWFGSPQNIGEGIRSMLSVRLGPSKYVTMVERANLDVLIKEQDLGASNRVRKGTNARIGQLTGADVLLLGEIVIFGRDDTTKRKGLGAILSGAGIPAAGAVATFNKSEKAVVGINLRLVDAETGEQIETADARGESSRSSKDYAGLLGVKGTAVGGATSMTSSNFQETIIGEATANSVAKIVEYLETKLPQLPAKARQIEGRVATVTSNGAYLTVGSEDGVLRGDRFEIFRINGEIKDPVTKEVLDVEVVKVGELVVDTMRDKSSTGRYGGQPLSASTISGTGYAARLKAK
jgi:curli biogenesis system outer membrane secretion channel CsgG